MTFRGGLCLLSLLTAIIVLSMNHLDKPDVPHKSIDAAYTEYEQFLDNTLAEETAKSFEMQAKSVFIALLKEGVETEQDGEIDDSFGADISALMAKAQALKQRIAGSSVTQVKQ